MKHYNNDERSVLRAESKEEAQALKDMFHATRRGTWDGTMWEVER